MVNLWKAIAFLAARPDVLRESTDAVKGRGIEIIRRSLEETRKQPTRTAVQALDDILNTKYKLRLGLYELSEINRWVQEDKLPQLLAGYAAALKLSPSTRPNLLEVAGVLLYDREFRRELENSASPGGLLRAKGFEIDDNEAAQVQNIVRNDPAVKDNAEDFFRLLWSGSVCAARLIFYDDYTHPNY